MGLVCSCCGRHRVTDVAEHQPGRRLPLPHDQSVLGKGKHLHFWRRRSPPRQWESGPVEQPWMDQEKNGEAEEDYQDAREEIECGEGIDESGAENTEEKQICSGNEWRSNELNASADDNFTPESLANSLRAQTDSDSVFAFYGWIKNNIRYNPDAGQYEADEQSVENILASRKATGNGLPRLMLALCESVDIECCVINGHCNTRCIEELRALSLKQVNESNEESEGEKQEQEVEEEEQNEKEQDGEAVEEETDIGPCKTAYSWNIVKVNGAWYLLDCIRGVYLADLTGPGAETKENEAGIQEDEDGDQQANEVVADAEGEDEEECEGSEQDNAHEEEVVAEEGNENDGEEVVEENQENGTQNAKAKYIDDQEVEAREGEDADGQEEVEFEEDEDGDDQDEVEVEVGVYVDDQEEFEAEEDGDGDDQDEIVVEVGVYVDDQEEVEVEEDGDSDDKEEIEAEEDGNRDDQEEVEAEEDGDGDGNHVSAADEREENSICFCKPIDTTKYAKWKRIDRHALKASINDAQTVKSLAEYLVKNAKTDIQRLRAFYIWILYNIDRNTEIVGDDADEQSAEDILAYRTATCKGFSRLMRALCDVIGIEIRPSGYNHEAACDCELLVLLNKDDNEEQEEEESEGADEKSEAAERCKCGAGKCEIVAEEKEASYLYVEKFKCADNIEYDDEGNFSVLPVRLCRPEYKVDLKDMEHVDHHALSAGARGKKPHWTVKSLEKYLSQVAKTELEKVRAFYTWILHHIKRLQSVKHGGTANEILACGEAENEGFARLLCSLCEAAGIECLSIDGNFKTGYISELEAFYLRRAEDGLDGEQEDDMTTVSKAFEEAVYMLNALHWWNIVKVDGQWRLIDCDWGALCVEMKLSFKDRFFYFLADPAVAADYYLPNRYAEAFTNADYQLLEASISVEEFCRRVCPSEYCHALGVELLTHHCTLVKVKKEARIKFRCSGPKITAFHVKLTDLRTKQVCRRSVAVSFDGQRGEIVARPPKAHRPYCLNVRASTEEYKRVEIVNYCLVAASGSLQALLPDDAGYHYGSSWDSETYGIDFNSIPGFLFGIESSQSKLKFRVHRSTELSIRLKSAESDTEIYGAIFAQFKENFLVVMVRMPEPGFYKLEFCIPDAKKVSSSSPVSALDEVAEADKEDADEKGEDTDEEDEEDADVEEDDGDDEVAGVEEDEEDVGVEEDEEDVGVEEDEEDAAGVEEDEEDAGVEEDEEDVGVEEDEEDAGVEEDEEDADVEEDADEDDQEDADEEDANSKAVSVVNGSSREHVVAQYLLEYTARPPRRMPFVTSRRVRLRKQMWLEYPLDKDLPARSVVAFCFEAPSLVEVKVGESIFPRKSDGSAFTFSVKTGEAGRLLKVKGKEHYSDTDYITLLHYRVVKSS